MKWRLAKKSTNVLYQTEVHRARPKAKLGYRDDLYATTTRRTRVAYGDKLNNAMWPDKTSPPAKKKWPTPRT